MAAILCQTIGELIGKCCELLHIPCKVCGKGCDKLGELMCTPFMPYIVVTFGLNTPAVVYAIKSFQYYSCSYELFRWLLINGVLSILHMMAAFYISHLIREDTISSSHNSSNNNNKSGANAIMSTQAAAEPIIMAETGTASGGKSDGNEKHKEPTTMYQTATPISNTTATTTNPNFYVPEDGTDIGTIPGGANSFKRIKHVLCYDKGMAVYILIFLFWMVWMIVGFTRRLMFAAGDNNDDCDELVKYMNISLVVGYVWMAMVGAAFCCSLLCLR